MSISTPGGDQRRPSVVSTGSKKPAAGAKPVATGKPAAGGKPGTPRQPGGGKGARKPVAPVKVSQGRAWGPIALFVAVGVLAAAIVGYGAYAVFQGSKSWEDKAADIPGIANIRKSDPNSLKYEKHQSGPIQYTKYTPPVGGVHNPTWQNCMGDVYDAQIANEHAVHSLEHGAVWITYRPDLPKDQVDKLAPRCVARRKC